MKDVKHHSYMISHMRIKEGVGATLVVMEKVGAAQ